MVKKPEIQSYRDLKVWQLAMDLVVVCYGIAAKLPASENYGLSSDLKRHSRLVAAYIADGKGRRTLGDYISKLSAAHGSLMALETDLLTTERLSFLCLEDLQPALDMSTSIGKMLNRLMTNLSSGRPEN
ncbi:MAG TPA: four helix bundle protein [Blastocatellia bacterium]|nr:four helix bundle protein [Blastocatellia bacterium]HMV86235.1 four helix bundle protein [Blastocatellia bacterium]HMX28147.1 four helix bundle protein [Blastocatellia bacterium]HMY75380.1 four helix bundle protein [Blastocatellia bacterium]HMZ19064.1 four helix bundle protein [Blastocatellia bacterium]